MSLNTNDSFSVLDHVRYNFQSNPLGGEPKWAGDLTPFFTVPQEMYDLSNLLDNIKWDKLGLSEATQMEYDTFAAILYGVPLAGATHNFIDNLAVFNSWIMVNIYPPSNLLDVGDRAGLPISYNKISVYALQHLRDRRDTDTDLRYDFNVFYTASLPNEPQSNVKAPLFPVVVEGGINFLKEDTSYRIARPLNINYPNCTINPDPYDDADLNYCNHIVPIVNTEIVPQLVGYQLTFGRSLDWAPQDTCGRTQFRYTLLDDKFSIVYQPYDEIIPIEERRSTPFVHLFNTNYIPTLASQAVDQDGYLQGTGFRNSSGTAPSIRAPRSQVGYPGTVAPVFIGTIDGFDISTIFIEDHKITSGEPIELSGFDLYDGFYTTVPYGDKDNIAIRASNLGPIILDNPFVFLTNAINWLSRDPLNLTSLLTRYQDVTEDACGQSSICIDPPPSSSSSGLSSSSASIPLICQDLKNYVYKVYVDNNGGDWADYIDVKLFKDAIVIALKEFGGSNQYLKETWVDLADSLNVIKDYFGNRDGIVPKSVVKIEDHELKTMSTDNDGFLQIFPKDNGNFIHTISVGEFVEIYDSAGTPDALTGYDGQYEVIEADDVSMTLKQEYIGSISIPSGAHVKLLAPFTFAGDLFNGVSLMLDTAFKSLSNQDDIRSKNLEDLSSWISTGFFDMQQRLSESISELKFDIRSGFDTIKKKVKEDVALTENSLISIIDESNENGDVGTPELEDADVNTRPDLSSVDLPSPVGAIHRVILDKIPRGVGDPLKLKDAISSFFWQMEINGPFARISQARLKVTSQSIPTDGFYNVVDDPNVRITNVPPVRSISSNDYSVVPATTDILKNDEMTEEEKIALNSNVVPNVIVDDDSRRISFLSSYRPMDTINSIPLHEISLVFEDALPVSAIHADSNSISRIKFEAKLSGIDIGSGLPLDFNNKIHYRIFGEYDGRYTDITDLISPNMDFWSQSDRDSFTGSSSSSEGAPLLFDLASDFSRYEYRVENSSLIGDITIDPANIPQDLFNLNPEMYNHIYKNIDIVLYYQDEEAVVITPSSSSSSSSSSPSSSSSGASSSSSSGSGVIEPGVATPPQIPLVTIPVFIYKVQKRAIIKLAYNPGINFSTLLSDTVIDPTYTLVLADDADNIIGSAEFSLVDLMSENRRLLSIGQYVDMLESDIGVPGHFNHAVGPYISSDFSGDFGINKVQQARIIEDYNKNILRVGQMFHISTDGNLEPWVLFSPLPSVQSSSFIDIFAYIAPAIGNMYRGLREHNDSENPYAQETGFFNHLNRFNNPHRNGVEQGNKLSYE